MDRALTAAFGRNVELTDPLMYSRLYNAVYQLYAADPTAAHRRKRTSTRHPGDPAPGPHHGDWVRFIWGLRRQAIRTVSARALDDRHERDLPAVEEQQPVEIWWICARCAAIDPFGGFDGAGSL